MKGGGGGARCPTEKIFLGGSRQKIYKIKGSPKNAQKSGKSRNKKPAPYRFIHFLGEGGGVTSETKLQTILQNYDKDDIYNADEFGLFYQALTKKNLHFKNENCTGAQQNKINRHGCCKYGGGETPHVCDR